MLPKRSPSTPSVQPHGAVQPLQTASDDSPPPFAPQLSNEPSRRPVLNREFGILASEVVALLVISFFLCVYKTGFASFGGGDQTTHAKVIQEMHYSGNWLHPTLYNWPYYNKPPFKMWLTLIPISIWGETNFAYRVIDGLCGVFLALTMFLFARSEFRSRTIGWLTALSLLSCQLLYYGHGIRNAVQDGMMLLLLTFGTVSGYYMVERLLDEQYLSRQSRRAIWRHAVIGGLCIGLGALTKNVAAYFSFAVIGIYLIAIGEVGRTCQRGWKQLLVIFTLALGCPAAYILAQGHLRSVAFQMLVVTEVYKRATKGYHMVGHDWMYWNIIVHSRTTVPPEMLFLSAAFALWMILRKRHRGFAIALCWGVVPILLQTMAKSKLQWYIMPALPGLSLLTGAGTGTALLALNERVRTAVATERVIPRWPTALLLALSVYTAGALAVPIYGIVDIFLHRGRVNEAEGFTKDVLDYAAASGSMPKIVMYHPPALARPEKFYFNRLGIDRVINDDREILRNRVASGEVTFVITTKDYFAEVAQLGSMTSYEFMPIRDNRYQVLIVVSFHPELLPRYFTPASRRISFGTNEENFKLAYGVKSAVPISRTFVRPSAGARTGIILEAGMPEQRLGTDVALQIASTIPSKDGKLRVHVYLNERRVAILDEVLEGLHWRHFYVPPGGWRNGQNMVTLVYEPTSGAPVDADAQLALLGSAIFTVRPALNP